MKKIVQYWAFQFDRTIAIGDHPNSCIHLLSITGSGAWWVAQFKVVLVFSFSYKPNQTCEDDKNSGVKVVVTLWVIVAVAAFISVRRLWSLWSICFAVVYRRCSFAATSWSHDAMSIHSPSRDVQFRPRSAARPLCRCHGRWPCGIGSCQHRAGFVNAFAFFVCWTVSA